MELYIGGMAQGKLDYVLEKYHEKELVVCDLHDIEEVTKGMFDALMTADVIHGYHQLVKYLVMQEQELYQVLDEIYENNPQVIIICDEVGAGVVPMKKEERLYRELVGRSCQQIARKACTVERVICGMGVKIK